VSSSLDLVNYELHQVSSSLDLVNYELAEHQERCRVRTRLRCGNSGFSENTPEVRQLRFF
jgi:hypothetical protein